MKRPPVKKIQMDFIAVLFLQPQCNITCKFCITDDGSVS